MNWKHRWISQIKLMHRISYIWIHCKNMKVHWFLVYFNFRQLRISIYVTWNVLEWWIISITHVNRQTRTKFQEHTWYKSNTYYMLLTAYLQLIILQMFQLEGYKRHYIWKYKLVYFPLRVHIYTTENKEFWKKEC